jgi:hypothetical protein
MKLTGGVVPTICKIKKDVAVRAYTSFGVPFFPPLFSFLTKSPGLLGLAKLFLQAAILGLVAQYL